MALPRKNFTSKLDGKNTYDYTSHIDYSIDTQQERINKVCEIFKNDDFYVDYFDNYFKVSPNTKEFLSIDNNVCNSLERFADYILLAPDKREEYRKGTRYIFYTEDKMNERIQREKSLEAITEQNDSSKYEETIMFLVDKGKNYKKEIKQDIFESDYDDTEIGLYLTDYKDVLDHYSQLFKDDKIINFKQRKQIKKLMREIKYDRLILKDKLKGTIYFESLLSESTCPDLYLINFTDKKHILYLLKCPQRDLLDDLGVIIYDLNNLLNQINLNEIEKEILNLWRNSNSMQTNIAKTLNVKRHFVDSTLNSICKRIVDKYKEQYEDWLYLNYLRGEYKRCSKCGEIKLISSFNKDASRRDGYKYICRKCEYVDKNDFKNGK